MESATQAEIQATLVLVMKMKCVLYEDDFWEQLQFTQMIKTMK